MPGGFGVHSVPRPRGWPVAVLGRSTGGGLGLSRPGLCPPDPPFPRLPRFPFVGDNSDETRVQPTKNRELESLAHYVQFAQLQISHVWGI